MKYIESICNEIAVSGYEDYLIGKIRDIVEGYCDKVFVDAIGNLICFRKGNGKDNKKQMIAAHVDEVGVQVTKIKEERIRFKVLGNIRCQSLLYQRIKFENGAVGVIYSDIDSLGKYEYDKLYITPINGVDIDVGDVGTFYPNFLDTEKFLVGKALDNRIGVLALIELLENKNTYERDTYFVFSVQEEIGLKGLKVALHSITPDIFYSIDASAINSNNNIEGGRGVAIKVSDSISVCDRKLVKEAKQLCMDKHFNFQMEVSNCGTSEIALVSQPEEAFRSLGISYPAKEIHTSQSLVWKEDVTALIQLLLSLLK